MDTTQFGLGALAAAILAALVICIRYFVTAMTQKDQRNIDLTEKVLQMTKDNIQIHQDLAKSIDANTKSSERSAQISVETSDKLSVLMLKILKNGGKKK